MYDSGMRFLYHWLVYFFFFQAEDGIRDLTVTGVQTCALPILMHAGLQKTFAMQANPETYGSQFWRRWKFLNRKVDLGLFRHEVHVCEDHNSADRKSVV